MKIIQIGANVGNDHVTQYLSENKNDVELAVLIEPVPFCIEKLKKAYESFPFVKIENVAIGDIDGGNVNFYYEENSNYEVSSFNRDHIINHGCPPEKIKCLGVEAKTVNSIAHKYGINKLHVLFIDSEGMDARIIRGIDYSEIIIENIYFESCHIDGTKKKGVEYKNLVDFLDSRGYDVSEFDSLNSVARLRG